MEWFSTWPIIVNGKRSIERCNVFRTKNVLGYSVLLLLPRGNLLLKVCRTACFHYTIENVCLSVCLFVCLSVCLSAQMKIKGFPLYFDLKGILFLTPLSFKFFFYDFFFTPTFFLLPFFLPPLFFQLF